MSDIPSQMDDVLERALNLSPIEKIRLVERLMNTLANDFEVPDKEPRQSLYGIWSDVTVTEDDIREARKEMWGNFPREDI